MHITTINKTTSVSLRPPILSFIPNLHLTLKKSRNTPILVLFWMLVLRIAIQLMLQLTSNFRFYLSSRLCFMCDLVMYLGLGQRKRPCKIQSHRQHQSQCQCHCQFKHPFQRQCQSQGQGQIHCVNVSVNVSQRYGQSNECTSVCDNAGFNIRVPVRARVRVSASLWWYICICSWNIFWTSCKFV